MITGTASPAARRRPTWTCSTASTQVAASSEATARARRSRGSRAASGVMIPCPLLVPADLNASTPVEVGDQAACGQHRQAESECLGHPYCPPPEGYGRPVHLGRGGAGAPALRCGSRCRRRGGSRRQRRRRGGRRRRGLHRPRTSIGCRRASGRLGYRRLRQADGVGWEQQVPARADHAGSSRLPPSGWGRPRLSSHISRHRMPSPRWRSAMFHRQSRDPAQGSTTYKGGAVPSVAAGAPARRPPPAQWPAVGRTRHEPWRRGATEGRRPAPPNPPGVAPSAGPVRPRTATVRSVGGGRGGGLDHNRHHQLRPRHPTCQRHQPDPKAVREEAIGQTGGHLAPRRYGMGQRPAGQRRQEQREPGEQGDEGAGKGDAGGQRAPARSCNDPHASASSTPRTFRAQALAVIDVVPSGTMRARRWTVTVTVTTSPSTETDPSSPILAR